MLQADTSDVLPPSGWFCHIKSKWEMSLNQLKSILTVDF